MTFLLLLMRIIQNYHADLRSQSFFNELMITEQTNQLLNVKINLNAFRTIILIQHSILDRVGGGRRGRGERRRHRDMINIFRTIILIQHLILDRVGGGGREGGKDEMMI